MHGAGNSSFPNPTSMLALPAKLGQKQEKPGFQPVDSSEPRLLDAASQLLI